MLPTISIISGFRLPGQITLMFISAMLIAAPSVSADRHYPVDYGRVTSTPGWRLDPFTKNRYTYHNGWDIACPAGTPVYPTRPGVITFAGQYKGYGLFVVVDHQDGYVTMYGHNSRLLVQNGQTVDTSTQIALSGSTGRSTGPHVHYEVRAWGPRNMPMLPEDVTGISSAAAQNENLNGIGGEAE